jgi:hypothetical protein
MHSIPSVITAVLLVAALGACRPKTPETPPAPTPPAPEAAAPAEETATGSTTSDAAQPAGAPVAPASSGNATASATPAPEEGPELAMMALASTSTKLGVPVDLRYSFDGVVEAGRPVTLHIAAVPRAAGSNLTVSIKEEPGIEAVAAPIRAQKASAGTAYRQQLSVTRAANGPAELRVLVTMDMPIGQAHSWFSVPFAARAAGTGKQVAGSQ